MADSKNILLGKVRSGEFLSGRQQLSLVLTLCLPAILAQLSTILMQYIDEAMVGHLGAAKSAAIGLVSTTTWIFGGFCTATNSGFSVQVAHLCGAGNFARARQVLRQALTSVAAFSVALALVGVAISQQLPVWLGGTPEIIEDARAYFLIYAAFLPAMQLSYSAGAMLQASGNMKVPAVLMVSMCIMDVVFNYYFIYVAQMGVRGVALGTGLAETVTALLMLSYLLFRSPELHLFKRECEPALSGFRPERKTLRTALGITGPMWFQNIILRGAYVMSTLIVSPLGTIAIAANSLAITAESFCYMPGYGLEEAATTLVGQSLGAKRRWLARRFALIATALGAAMMTALAVLMYAFAPQMMGILTNVGEVIEQGAQCLRLEAFAETFYGVSIVAYGACVGAGDTKIPSIINFASIWVVRIGLAVLLTPRFGLMGYWMAMMLDLNVRGILFLIRILGHKWMKKEII